MRPRRFIPLLAALAGLSLIATGCGDELPSDAVAEVGDTVISEEEFDHWLQAAAKGQQPPGTGEVVVPDPPDFTECVAAKKKQPAPPGAEKPTDDQLKDQCEQEFDALKQQVMQFLISAEWIQQEAEDRDIEVTEEEVQKQFEDQKKQSFPNEKDYQQFLETSGQTEDDLLFRVRLDVLSNKVREAIIEGKGDVSDEDIAEYYEENKERFAQPERRDLNVVLTRTEAKAEEALAELESGQSFKDVAQEYSIDEASKSQGGKLPAVAEGQQEKAFDDAIFAAETGELTGPVKTQFGWYVFEVSDVTPASQQTLEDATETIRSLLKSEREQEALDDFIEEFREKYKDETQCADDYVVEDCDNFESSADTGPASGGSPQVAPPQGAPPTGVPVPPQGAPPTGAPPTGAPPTGAPPQGQPVPVPPQG
ncbi:MAG TPA: peptidyl-prolyl cis-trans isomerase [Thermoleophilaceae bacterium]|nr:peptidyl-prolyl cis-trans isomerase [Thermoleophilaceae bacterium]